MAVAPVVTVCPSSGTAPRTVVVIASYADSLINFRGVLLRAMVERGHRVIAMAPASPDIERKLATMGVAFRSFALARTGLNPVRDLRTLQALIALLREVRPDVVLCYTIKPIIYGSLAARW